MTAWPKISVLTIVRNGVDFIGGAIESVLDQNYPALEYIVLDGASTDGTQDVIERYRSRLAFYESTPDQGPGDAFNKGMQRAAGWLVVLNADDRLAPGTLHALGEAALANPQAKVLCGGAELRALGSGRLLLRYNKPDQLMFNLKNMLAGLTLFNAKAYRRDIFGPFKLDYPGHRYFIANDRHYLIQLALESIPCVVVPGALYRYYTHADSITFSGSNLLHTLEEHFWIADYWLARAASPAARNLLKNWKAEQYIVLAAVYVRQKKWRQAGSVLLKSIRELQWRPFTQFIKVLHRNVRNRAERMIHRMGL